MPKSSKIIILGDLHCCARGGSSLFSDYFNRFFNEVLYPYCQANNIEQILQLGDLIDNRTSLQYKQFHASKDIWFKKMGDLGIKMTVLLGNHDICYKHSLSINSPELLLGEYDHIQVIKEPTQLKLGKTTFDIVPWICDENRKDIESFISRKDRGSVLLGHLELSNFPMSKGDQPHKGGDDPDLFDGYGLVFQGHFHTRSSKGNIIYTGIPYEITWADYADPKGFYVYDTETGAYEFVRNELTIFEKLYYKDGCSTDIKGLRGKIVRVMVIDKGDPVKYDRWLDSVRLIEPHELKIVDGEISVSDAELDGDLEITDTRQIIKNYIDKLETTVQVDDLNSYMQNLYNEALTVDDTL